jgi:hypothetical protein
LYVSNTVTRAAYNNPRKRFLAGGRNLDEGAILAKRVAAACAAGLTEPCDVALLHSGAPCDISFGGDSLAAPDSAALRYDCNPNPSTTPGVKVLQRLS